MTPPNAAQVPSVPTHPAFSTRFPPDEYSFAGSLMLDVAVGLKDERMLRDRVWDLLQSGEFPLVYPDEPVPTLDEGYALLEEIIRTHDEAVPAVSADVAAFTSTIQTLLDEAGIVTSLSGFDAQESADDAYAAALALQRKGRTVRGYLYIHQQDLERVVFVGHLFVGFGAMSGDDADAAEVARTAQTAYRAAGLPVGWDGDPGMRISVSPFQWCQPLRDPQEVATRK